MGDATPLAAGALTGLAHVRFLCVFFERGEGVALCHSAEREGGREGGGRHAEAEAETDSTTDSQRMKGVSRVAVAAVAAVACLPSRITGST